MTNSTDFGLYLTKYLSDYLPNQINASKNTALAYRDTFSLLLEYMEKVCKSSPDKLTIAMLDVPAVVGFLSWLESDRGYTVSSRNHRLAIVRAFFKFLQFENPKYLAHCQGILGIRHKKTHSKPPEFLSKEAMTAILSMPDIRTRNSYRDLVLLALMYDTGARVQEICDLRVCDIKFQEFPSITLHGKGNKSRNVPIMAKTTALLEKYIATLELAQDATDTLLFLSHRKHRLTRNGIAFILRKYAKQAREKNPGLIPEKVSPHMMRHSKAMHLVQSGVNIIYIRDFLGHTNIKATEIYARADSEMKRLALSKAGQEKISPNNASWNKDAGLVAWLKAFGK